MSKKFAVILAGCGFLDGAEIRESVLTLLALDTEGATYEIFAPNKNQHHVINHLKGEEEKSQRNILEESARIARGKIRDLNDINCENFDALIFPGGYGVAKNLCEFAFKGAAGSVDSQVRATIEAFYQAKKPIGGICIAPALLALTLGQYGIEVTIGNHEETAAEINKTGAKHSNRSVENICVDASHKIVTTPAYMYDSASLDKIFMGIQSCVKEVIKLS